MELDQMESMFRSAYKTNYQYHNPHIQKVLLITDTSAETTEKILKNLKRYLSALGRPDWCTLGKEDYRTVRELIDFCEQEQPDLIVTYRNLFYEEKGLSFSLGVYLDMLTQATDVPILVLPHLEDKNYESVLENTNEVMVVTDHLAGDHRLIDYGVKFTEHGGHLFLAHVEHMTDYKRYVAAISKIPELDTKVAEVKLAQQLLKEPREFIGTCKSQLDEQNIDLEIVPLITFGHTVKTYRELLQKHNIDLLILHTKDGDQLAMHGDAYSIAVEFSDLPLLLI